MFFLKKIADCLLGEDSQRLWLTEFYGDSELALSMIALKKAAIYDTVAYLDPFDNLRLQNKKPDLILKPNSTEQAILMSLEMLKTKIIKLLIVDSLFLLPRDNLRAEESLVLLVKAAEENSKPVFLLNPENQTRKLLQKNLKSFCNSQIWVN